VGDASLWWSDGSWGAAFSYTMMEVLMKKFLMTVGLAVALAAMAVSSASATGMLNSRSPIGTGSNTASVADSMGPNLAASILGVTGATVTCPDVTYNVTQVTTFDARVDPSFGGGCLFLVSGTPVGTATVNTAGASLTLTATHSTFGDGLGSDITVDVNGPIIITTAVGCTLTIPSQSNKGGGTSIQSQNIDTTGANTTSTSPWGAKITATSLSLTYTTHGSCPGIAEHGNDSFFTGSVYVKNVWGSL
jgi:hypothetical protein